MTARRRRAAAAALTALALAACSAEPEAAPVTATIQAPAPVPGAATTAATTTADEPTESSPADTRPRPVNQTSVNAEQAYRTAAAATAATIFMRAYARPKLDAAAWHAGVAPLLTASARDAARDLDPATISGRKVTGRATVLPGAEPDARTVTVATDAGTYTLFLLWDRPASRWLVQTCQPPETHQDE